MEVADRTEAETALEQELDAKYPNRPHNHSKTFAFHDLFQTLFNPLNENKAKPTGGLPRARRRLGRFGPTQPSPHEARRIIIERFISRWRQQVGNDIYPVFRLIMPDKDRDRHLYGLKEKAIAKLLVRAMKIDKNSEDGSSLLNWKVPSNTAAARMAGDFPGRCFEVIKKRPVRTEVGNVSIEEVNKMLDRLSLASGEQEQYPIIEEFYTRMNPDELLWLIRIILKAMKVGATEKTFLNLWHPDAEALFNVCSSLRRVCWELPDPSIRLHQEEVGIALMQPFQPQLAQFQMDSFQKMVTKLRLTPEDPIFWIEEKLDGERLQMHMVEDYSVPGGKRFGFWSRKAKNYDHLYGTSFEDENGSLTRHIKDVFDPQVSSIVLDGEMITWDPVEQAMVPFGSLKTAAIAEKRNPFTSGHRPLFKVFDCLYLNGQTITKYTLRDRRRALEKCVRPVHQRIEIHERYEAQTTNDIETMLRQMVAEASEGLVLKNPRSMYRLNDRNDDWLKVKPEYMDEFGENLDCTVIGGYYGSGSRGGRLSSFLCGLRVDQRHIDNGADPVKHLSFFKVGGGFNAGDYARIRQHTEGRWHKWDRTKPPSHLIQLAGTGQQQYERPDVWIRPDESVVIAVKAASVTTSDKFRVGLSLRFPRFKNLRLDRDWSTALDVQGFMDLKNNVDKEVEEKRSMTFAARRKNKKPRVTAKRPLTIAGNAAPPADAKDDNKGSTPLLSASSSSSLFDGLAVHIMTESTAQPRKTKAELEALVRAHGGTVVSSPFDAHTRCIADKRVVKVASLIKTGGKTILRPSWLLDAVRQHEADGRPVGTSLLPSPEPRHIFHAADEDVKTTSAKQIDEWGDSYVLDVRGEGEMRALLEKVTGEAMDVMGREDEVVDQRLRAKIFGGENASMYLGRGALFANARLAFIVIEEEDDGRVRSRRRKIRFGAGTVVERLREEDRLTHVVVGTADAQSVREQTRDWRKLPRLVTGEWVDGCWEAETLLAEERYRP